MNRRELLQHGLTKLTAGVLLSGGSIFHAEMSGAIDRGREAKKMLRSPTCKDLTPDECLPNELEQQHSDWMRATTLIGGALLIRQGGIELLSERIQAEEEGKISKRRMLTKVESISELARHIDSDKKIEVHAKPIAFTQTNAEDVKTWRLGADIEVIDNEEVLAWTRVSFVDTSTNRSSQLSRENSRDSIQILISTDQILDEFRQMPHVTSFLIGPHGLLDEESRLTLHEAADARWIEPIPIHK